jgi:hypothetical protein
MPATIEQSPLEKYNAQHEATAKHEARKHSTPRLDAFRARLPNTSTSKLIEYVADYRARKIEGTVLFAALLCAEVLVPYRDSSMCWTGPHVEGRPPFESYPADYNTLYAGYVAVCDEIDRRFSLQSLK